MKKIDKKKQKFRTTKKKAAHMSTFHPTPNEFNVKVSQGIWDPVLFKKIYGFGGGCDQTLIHVNPHIHYFEVTALIQVQR